jgi:hypothetical protein
MRPVHARALPVVACYRPGIMRALDSRWVRCTGSTLLLAATCGCEENANAFIMSQVHRVAEERTEAPAVGYTCADVSEGSGSTSGGERTDDFWMREETTSAGLFVQIGSFESVLEARFYDRDFIAAHEVDRFVVTTLGGDQYAFVFWGGDSCEECPPGDFEALPGDPWGCGGGALGAP